MTEADRIKTASVLRLNLSCKFNLQQIFRDGFSINSFVRTSIAAGAGATLSLNKCVHLDNEIAAIDGDVT